MNRGTVLPTVQVAYNALQQAKQTLVEVLMKEYPIGTKVLSHARKPPIRGTVAGIQPAYSHKVGSVVVVNDSTGKSHDVYPYSSHSALEKL